MILLEIPETPKIRTLEIHRIVSDYTGTHAFGGRLRKSVRKRLERLATFVEIHIVTSDTFGTAAKELESLPVTPHFLDSGIPPFIEGIPHDVQKRLFVIENNPNEVAAFGNGNNDRLLLEAVKFAGGLAVAVDNGEGCAIDAIKSANIFIRGSERALDLLLEHKRCIATLRF